MADTQRLKGRVALVTGGSRGIGRSIALGLAEAGASVAVNYRERHEAAEAVCAEIRKLERAAIAVQADVGAAEDIERLASTVEQELGEVEILVNNAGITQVKRFDTLTEADWDEIVRVNLKSAFLLTQRVLPAMRKRHWGRIINLSSVAAQTGGVIGPHYAASKAGLIGLTHSYASLLAKEGITVNAIAPALIETEMVTKNSNASPERLPVGFFGEPEEIGRVAVMLAESEFTTGQTISVNGGWYMTS
ncbi:MAG TPA: 3-oxoacyl-ACP reductase family protein [Candidatus Saccharimonadales bacterium]|nr:3-oxoacyl-ACP reductase family protein [Candidatus Saccharimonadales bacterium]